MEQQGGSGWFGGSQQRYGGHPPPQRPPHPSMLWQVTPEAQQHFNRPPQMHPSQQQQHPPQQHQYQPGQGQQSFQAQGGYYGQPAGYYAPQHQQQVPQAPAPHAVAAPPPLSQPHGTMFSHSEQGWPSSNGWSQAQWPSAGGTQLGSSTAGVSQEEEWAAKARAWAASKAAQEAQQHTQSEQSFPDNLQQLPPPPPPPPPPPQPVDLPQQFLYQAPGHEPGSSAYDHDVSSVYGHDISHKYGQDSAGTFGWDTSSRSQGEEMKSFAPEGSAPGSKLVTTPAPPPPPPPTPRNISEVGASSYSQDLSSSHNPSAPSGGMEQLQMPQLPVPPPPPPPASASLPHLSHQQPPQSASQLSPHQQTAHLQSQTPPSQFSFGEPPAPASYDFPQQAPYEFQQAQPQEYQHSQPSQFNMTQDVPEAGAYGGLPHPQTWPPQMPYPPNNVGPGIGAGPCMGHQFEYEFEHMHPGHQHPQHLQGHTMFPRPPHGPGFRPGGPPLGHFAFGGNPALGPGVGAGMDFSMFIDNGHGHNLGLERPKKASVPNWLKEELLKKKAAVAGGAQLAGTEDNPLANGDTAEASTHNKFELSDRSRSDLSRMSDSDDDDEEDDTEAARTAAMNQEIKRVLTEVLLKVTDDLFDEIAQEVMDEDEQRLLGDPTKKALLAEELGGAKAKSSTHASVLLPVPAHASAPVRVLAPAVKRGQVDSDDDSESLGSGAPAGNLLGLASYASDDEDAGRNSRQVTEAEHVNGGNSGTVPSELKSLAAEEGKLKHVISEEEVVSMKEVKGKKRLSEEALNSGHSGRSPRRARHAEVAGDEAAQNELAASLKPGVTVNQVKIRAAVSQKPDSGVAVEGRGSEEVHAKEGAVEDKLNHKTRSQNALSTERRKLEDGHDHLSKRRSAEDSSYLRRVDKETVPSGKREHGVETDFRKAVRDKDHSNVKQGTKEADGYNDHKNGIKREKDSSRDDKDRVRESKERGRDRELLRGKEKEYNVQKIKERERESDLAREKDKDRGKGSKTRGRDADRSRRKSTSEKYDRKSTEYKKEKEKGSKKARRKRSSSLSSRSRSRSRSESSSASGSRSSSPSPVRSGTPRRGKQQRERSSKKSSHASPPSRSRRRTSRSPSRSVPHSKVSHRRHSPSLSREKERNRKSRSASPAPKRRRS